MALWWSMGGAGADEGDVCQCDSLTTVRWGGCGRGVRWRGRVRVGGGCVMVMPLDDRTSMSL
jgi:hypothetical protein